MKKLEVKIKKLKENAVIPTYAKDGDFCMDLTAIDVVYDKTMDCFIYFTGLAFEVPKGYGMLIFPRSSNRKTEAYMCNHVGVIDSGYRGEVLVCFKNRTNTQLNDVVCCRELREISNPPYKIGDRIAQLCILPYPQIEFVETNELSDSERGADGHGSTGR